MPTHQRAQDDVVIVYMSVQKQNVTKAIAAVTERLRLLVKFGGTTDHFQVPAAVGSRPRIIVH